MWCLIQVSSSMLCSQKSLVRCCDAIATDEVSENTCANGWSLGFNLTLFNSSCSQPKYRPYGSGSSMSMTDDMDCQPFFMFSVGPAIFKSSTYTTKSKLYSGWKNIDFQTSWGTDTQPLVAILSSKCFSQIPPLSGWPYRAKSMGTKGSLYNLCQSFGQRFLGKRSQVGIPVNTACVYACLASACSFEWRGWHP